jgi:hypothetical protein
MNTMLEVDDGKVVSFVTGKLIQIGDESKHLTAVMRTLLERRVQVFLYTWNECGLYEDLPDVKKTVIRPDTVGLDHKHLWRLKEGKSQNEV